MRVLTLEEMLLVGGGGKSKCSGGKGSGKGNKAGKGNKGGKGKKGGGGSGKGKKH